MQLSDTVKSLLKNDKDLCKSAINTLLKIANNIINCPNEAKYRSINLNGESTEKYLLPAVGALEVLFLMGFEEGSEKLILPDHVSLDLVTTYRDQLEQLKRENLPEKPTSKTEGNIAHKKNRHQLNDAELAKILVSEEKMKNELELQFKHVLIFESPRLQEEAKAAMPYQLLSQRAKKREASLKVEADSKSCPLDFQDCILIELLAWFKEDFFSWFDRGFCKSCSLNMKSIGHVSPNKEESEYGGDTVEKYECEKCKNEIRFARYFHPGKLLKTKRGRCMEWASCFTLMCRSLGLDARYIFDKTDHVWTEVFSRSQNRWLHADPCENKLDSPLMYEKGWKKSLSYIFGFSKDEVVDVVWRYTTDHEGVCNRRKSCREDWLAVVLHTMNQECQKSFSESKRKFLEMRLVSEIAGFFAVPPATTEGDYEGRSSGSLSWRLSRGETCEATNLNIFVLNDCEMESKEMVVKYSPSKDIYIRDSSGSEKLSGWKSGVYSVKNIFRKYEKDWKIVYLARNDGTCDGEIKWRFEWTSRSLQVESVLVVFQHKTFEDGVVLWHLCSGELCLPGNQDGVLRLSGEELDEKCHHLEICATLSKGKGDVAYQHAQLFRQKDDESSYPFYLKIKFS